MNIKITKNIEEANLITHSATFHADEIFATVILSKIISEVTLIRVNELKEEVSGNVIVYDIGMGEYDHHQFGGNGTRENGVKYAACGLVWKAFGRKVLEKYNVKDIEFVFDYVDKNLIQFIDADDNGQLPKIDFDYRYVHISQIIGLFNPAWDEQIDSDIKFLKALSLAEMVFDEFMRATISKVKARDEIEKEVEKSENGIVILEKYMPWKEWILESKNPKAKQINYVVFPSKRGGYNVYAVPIETGSFENRKSLPKSWRGLKEEKLQAITGVKSAKFCHNAGFICSCGDKEDAIKLATIANLT